MFKVFICILLSTVFSSLISAQELFKSAESKGEIENRVINEASGIAASINQPDLLWTHNDSGDSARLFLINQAGASVGQYYLQGAQNRDWEDIATGPGPIDERSYIYVGDIGDNRARYEIKTIYRIEEPTSSSAQEITTFDTIRFRYPDGKRDAESLFVDPQTKDIYILSKREDKIGVYVARYPQSITDVITLEKLSTIPYHNTVAADISADGQEILLKTYSKVYYWKRNNKSINDTLNSPPVPIPYQVEPQGEAIAWLKDGSGFFTLSEKRIMVDPVLYFYARKL